MSSIDLEFSFIYKKLYGVDVAVLYNSSNVFLFETADTSSITEPKSY